MFSGQTTSGKLGAWIQSDGLHRKPSSGESAQTLQVFGFEGLHTKPGLQPHVRSDLGSNGGTGAVFVGAGHEVTWPRMVVATVTVCAGAVTVIGGCVIVTGGWVTVCGGCVVT